MGPRAATCSCPRSIRPASRCAAPKPRAPSQARRRTVPHTRSACSRLRPRPFDIRVRRRTDQAMTTGANSASDTYTTGRQHMLRTVLGCTATAVALTVSSLAAHAQAPTALDFGIGEPNSTSGFLVPTACIFAAKGVDPKSCFKTVRNANHQANAMAVANKQVAAATNNSEDLQRLEMPSPEARAKIKIIWTSPIIPLDPIIWRKDLDAGIKAKLYTFMLGYGRVGSLDEIKAAKEMIAAMIWSPLRPSSDDQLLPMRKLEASKDLLKIQSDAKLSDEEKKTQSAAVQAQIVKIDEMEKKAATDPFQKRLAAFVGADKAGKQDGLKRMIAEFTAANARTH